LWQATMKIHTSTLHPRELDSLRWVEPVPIVDPEIQDRDGDEFVGCDLRWYRQRPYVRQLRQLVLFKQENRAQLGYGNTDIATPFVCPNLEGMFNSYHEINWASRKHLNTDTPVSLHQSGFFETDRFPHDVQSGMWRACQLKLMNHCGGVVAAHLCRCKIMVDT
jgi:hypothetical protein